MRVFWSEQILHLLLVRFVCCTLDGMIDNRLVYYGVLLFEFINKKIVNYIFLFV